MEAAAWHLDLLHVGLGVQRDDGLVMSTGSGRHRMHGFNSLVKGKEDSWLSLKQNKIAIRKMTSGRMYDL